MGSLFSNGGRLQNPRNPRKIREIRELEEDESMLALVLMNQWFTGRVGAANRVARAALTHVARLARLGLELADHEAVAAAIGVELAVGAVGTEAGVAGAGFEELHLLVALHFVGGHGGAALVAGQLLGVVGRGDAGTFFAGGFAGHGECGAILGVGRRGSSETQAAKKCGNKQSFHGAQWE